MSPVSTQSSRIRDAVASGSCQNPSIWPSQRMAISPSPPMGTGVPSSGSRMARSANGSGRPADRSGLEPGTSENHSRGPIIVTGSASVWPNPWYSTGPNTSRHNRAVSSDTGAPPIWNILSADQSRLRAVGWWARALAMVGTVNMYAIRSASITSMVSSSSNRSRRTFEPPESQIGVNRYPEPCEMGPTCRHRSPSSTGGKL